MAGGAERTRSGLTEDTAAAEEEDAEGAGHAALRVRVDGAYSPTAGMARRPAAPLEARADQGRGSQPARGARLLRRRRRHPGRGRPWADTLSTDLHR